MEPSASARPNNKGTVRLFENPFLERLTRTHIALPLFIFGAGSAGLMYYGFTNGFLSLLSAIGLFMIGWLIFSLIEYMAHRHVFHMEPDTPIKKDIQYKFHGNHHDFPKDKERLAMPPIISLLIASVFFFTFELLFGKYAFGLVSGLLFGYGLYLFVHYAVHAFAPPKNFLKTLWIHHSIHHYKDPNRAYGVSSPLWDWVFGTMPLKNK